MGVLGGWVVSSNAKFLYAPKLFLALPQICLFLLSPLVLLLQVPWDLSTEYGSNPTAVQPESLINPISAVLELFHTQVHTVPACSCLFWLSSAAGQSNQLQRAAAVCSQCSAAVMDWWVCPHRCAFAGIPVEWVLNRTHDCLSNGNSYCEHTHCRFQECPSNNDQWKPDRSPFASSICCSPAVLWSSLFSLAPHRPFRDLCVFASLSTF